jgi:molecular chaperone GrpE
MAKNKKEDEIEENASPEQEKPHKVKKDKTSREQELENQLAERNNQLLRLAAEYDNFRKRSQREKDELFKSSKATVVQELLPVIDNFERAGKMANQSPADYKKGMELVYSQFLDIIKKLGIETFGEPGEDFDPNIHSAVMHVEDDSLEENVIAEVLSKGYKLGEKIIRSATVKVAN